MNYRGRCIGRLNLFLKEYGVDAYNVSYSDGEMKLYGRKLGTYTFEENFGLKDVPYFTFTEEFKHCNSIQDTKKNQIVEDDLLLGFIPGLEGREYFPKEVIRILVKSQYYITLYFSGESKFFLYNHEIWAEDKGNYYKWNDDLSDWLWIYKANRVRKL